MKKRILFVESDPLQMQMYSMMMDDERERWEVSGVGSPEKALELLNASPYDVVVSDLSMPRMDGIQFMSAVRERSPGCARIIMSVQNDQEQVARSLNETHQFIAKPFDVRVFKSTLSRICGLDSYLKEETLRSLVGRLGTLPSFPSLYVEVTRELSSLDASIDRIAAIIARDPAMTAKMLQIVNSAAVGLSRKVSSPFEAVQFLGFGTVRSLVLSAHIFARCQTTHVKGFSLDRLWTHGMKSAQIACLILQLEQANPADVEDAFIAAMLHDVGKLMLAESMPEQFQLAIALAADRHIPPHEAEFEVFGATHAGVAAYLFGLWGLPASIVEAVAFHHDPDRSDLHTLGPLAAVHAADALEHELSKSPDDGPPELDLKYIAGLKLESRLRLWRTEATRLVA